MVRGDICKIPRMLSIVDQGHLYPVEIQIEDDRPISLYPEFTGRSDQDPVNGFGASKTTPWMVSVSDFETNNMDFCQLDGRGDVL